MLTFFDGHSRNSFGSHLMLAEALEQMEHLGFECLRKAHARHFASEKNEVNDRCLSQLYRLG